MLLPEFAKMVYECSLKSKNKPTVLFCHIAFSDDEYKLMGSAIKHCALKHISVIVVGKTDGKDDIEIDSTDYGVEDVEALGKKVKKLAQIHKAVKIPSYYFRICENCGIDFEDEYQTFKQGTQNYYHKIGKVEKFTKLSMQEVKILKNKN